MHFKLICFTSTHGKASDIMGPTSVPVVAVVVVPINIEIQKITTKKRQNTKKNRITLESNYEKVWSHQIA
jgi:hypothetical protein